MTGGDFEAALALARAARNEADLKGALEAAEAAGVVLVGLNFQSGPLAQRAAFLAERVAHVAAQHPDQRVRRRGGR